MGLGLVWVFIFDTETVSLIDMDSRIREACLSVYMAYRDHYPSYLVYLDQERIERLNSDIQKSSGKIIKLRRIVLSQLSKVA